MDCLAVRSATEGGRQEAHVVTRLRSARCLSRRGQSIGARKQQDAVLVLPPPSLYVPRPTGRRRQAGWLAS